MPLQSAGGSTLDTLDPASLKGFGDASIPQLLFCDAIVTRDGSGSLSGALGTGRVRCHTVYGWRSVDIRRYLAAGIKFSSPIRSLQSGIYSQFIGSWKADCFEVGHPSIHKADAMARYATEHGFKIVKTYSDGAMNRTVESKNKALVLEASNFSATMRNCSARDLIEDCYR